MSQEIMTSVREKGDLREGWEVGLSHHSDRKIIWKSHTGLSRSYLKVNQLAYIEHTHVYMYASLYVFIPLTPHSSQLTFSARKKDRGEMGRYHGREASYSGNTCTQLSAPLPSPQAFYFVDSFIEISSVKINHASMSYKKYQPHHMSRGGL